MKQKIFLDSDAKKHCIDSIYSLLMTKQWVSHPMFLAQCMGKPLDAYENVKLSSLTDRMEKYYKHQIGTEIKNVINAIEEECPGSIDTNGKGKGIMYRYIGDKEDPLKEQKNASPIEDLQTYWDFCQNSAGLMPTEWLEHFFKNTRNLLNIKKEKAQGRQIIKASADRNLSNIGLLPQLYEAIIQKKTIMLSYKPYDDKVFLKNTDLTESNNHVNEGQPFVFHPQFLYEFDGRWQVLGYVKEGLYDPMILSLDRIVDGSFEYVDGVKYVEREPGYFEDYFSHSIGSSHVEGGPKTIRVRAHSKQLYGLTLSKPIFSPFKVICEFGVHDDGEYGEFEYTVHPNNEFYGRIMSNCDDLEIVSPPEIREEAARRLKRALGFYVNDSE